MWYPLRKLATTMALLQDGISGVIALPPPQAIIRDEVGAFPRTMKKTALQSKIGPMLVDCHGMYLSKIMLWVMSFGILFIINAYLSWFHAFEVYLCPVVPRHRSIVAPTPTSVYF
jgi:hypothetical protein